MNFITRILSLMLLLISPSLVWAHSPIKGMGEFVNGMIHPLMVPEQVLVIVSLGLLFGQHQPIKLVHAALFFLGALIAGLLIAGFTPEIKLATWLLLGAFFIGILIITGIRLPQSLFIVLGILSGILAGLDSNPGDLQGKARVASLFGSGVGIYFLFLYAMAFSESFSRKGWQQVVVKVISSWLSASALMVLALNFSGKL